MSRYAKKWAKSVGVDRRVLRDWEEMVMEGIIERVSFLRQRHIYKYEKHFQKMYRDVGMAVPKTTETRCRDGSVQGRHVIQRLHN